MSTQNQPKKKAPIHTIRDGAVSLKIWENFSKEGRPFYNVTFGRTYTDKATGYTLEGSTLRASDLDKLFYLSTEAKRIIGMVTERNAEIQRTQAQGQPQAQQSLAQGLSAQRDAALANIPAPAPQQGNGLDNTVRQNTPDIQQ
ncbi:MAG: hypothetical protein COA69_08565 [Robiginitomaculum sp.]|nr:MAG: hypothetical protein COA69_08565 [Robiginitomaculum sp.]